MATTRTRPAKAFIRRSAAHGQLFDDLDSLLRRLYDAQAPAALMAVAYDLQETVQNLRELLLQHGFEAEAELLQEQICPGDARDYDPD